MSYEQHCREDARLAILAELARQRDGTLNSRSMTQVLDALGIRRSQDWVETQIAKLEELGAVNVTHTDLPGMGRVAIATLTRSGREHVDRRALISGIAAPSDPD